MAKYATLSGFLTACMDAVRAQKGTSEKIIGENLPEEIASIPTGGRDPVTQALTVVKNATYTAPSGVDGFNPVTVNVPTGPAIGIPMEYLLTDVAQADSGSGWFLRGSSFVKQHRLDKGFFALVIPAFTAPIKYIRYDFGTNFVISQANNSAMGITVSASSETNNLVRLQTGAISGTPEGYNGCLITNGSGDLFCYTGGLQKVAAGKYHIIMGVLPM